MVDSGSCVWWRLLGLGICGWVVLEGWWSILDACGFEGWKCGLRDCEFVGWWAVLCGGGGASLWNSLGR